MNPLRLRDLLSHHLIPDLSLIVPDYMDVEVKFLRQLGREGPKGGEFYFPSGIAVLPLPDGRAEIIVADSYNHRIQVFAMEGKFLRQWGKAGLDKGEFYYPGGIAVLSLPNRGEEIFVTDTTNHRVPSPWRTRRDYCRRYR